jgi:hypothetical protein
MLSNKNCLMPRSVIFSFNPKLKFTSNLNMTPQQFNEIYHSVFSNPLREPPVSASTIDLQVKALTLFLLKPSMTLEELREKLVIVPLYSDGFPRQPAVLTKPRVSFLITHLNLLSSKWPLPVPTSASVLFALETKNGGPGMHKAYNSTIDRLLGRLSMVNAAHDTGALQALLNHTPFNPIDFLGAMNFLVSLPGVSLAAAQHILSDLGWAAVKPDVHVVRVLHRLGGWGRNHFRNENSRCADLPGRGDLAKAVPLIPRPQDKPDHRRALLFQQGFQTFVDNLGKQRFNAPIPTIPSSNLLTIRQIDKVLMMFTQTGMNPPPICTAAPLCNQCRVSSCDSRSHSLPAV